MGEVALLSLTSALTLLTATTVMLLLPNRRRLMLGYWLGAMVTSITLGLVIVFALPDSGAVSTAKQTLSPLADYVLAALFATLAFVLATGRDQRVRAKRATRREGKDPPRW
jgi:asparagine N-glycosylation enzyme membrane subunit Stt3